MRIFLIIGSLILLLSCNSNKSTDEEEKASDTVTRALNTKKQPMQPDKEHVVEKPIEAPAINYAGLDLDSVTRKAIIELDRRYVSTPYYAHIEGRNFFIICSGKAKYNSDWFSSHLKYGIADDSLKELLPRAYDKIYNPNLTIKGYFEIKSGKKVGLVNYKSGAIVKPQFEYILPGGNPVSDVAYGYKNNGWVEIRNDSLHEAQFDPQPILESLSYDVSNIGESMMYDSYYQVYENDPTIGKGVVINPSYVEHLHLLPSEYYADIILPEQGEKIDFGTEAAGMKTYEEKSLSDKLISFFVTIYESGIDARGYNLNQKNLLVYNKEKETLVSSELGSLSDYDYFCREGEYHFVNDSILEIKSNDSEYDLTNRRYNFETKYTYQKVHPDGELEALHSNRYFDFTKYVYIDEDYFKGCFAIYMDEPEEGEDSNIWVSDHLTIHDLDIMRNEIFAEYGYKFKTPEWQEYFVNKSWYSPQFDDVNDQLTDIDRENIKVILGMKEKMMGNEELYTQKRAETYHAAG